MLTFLNKLFCAVGWHSWVYKGNVNRLRRDGYGYRKKKFAVRKCGMCNKVEVSELYSNFWETYVPHREELTL
jgi:hypothetical protein